MTEMRKTSAAAIVLAGGLAGASETLVTYPAEFLKTRRQLPEAKMISFLSITRSTYAAQGLAGFYSGCGALATSNALKSGIRFFSFEATRNYLDRKLDVKGSQRSPWVNILAGLSAGVAESLLVVTPGEVLKTRIVQESALGRSKGLYAIAAHILRNEGPRALWRGVGPVLCKQGTNSAVRFSTFAILQEKLYTKYPDAKGRLAGTLMLGAVSGMVTVYASMPFDNVKTRIQSGGQAYAGMSDCISKTLREEGALAFWRGTTPRLVRLTLSSAITFMVYDQVLSVWKSMEHLSEEKSLSTSVL